MIASLSTLLGRRSRVRRAVVVAAACLLCCLPELVSAQPQWHHTAWTRQAGAPSGIIAIAQTVDGWLWLGTLTGLYRFDGVQFERVEEVEGSVRSLFAPADGGLWIRYSRGGASFLRDGRLASYGEEQGLPRITVYEFARDRRGVMWAAASDGLFKLDGARWTRVQAVPGVAMKYVSSVVVDREGTLWVRAGDDIFALPQDAQAFRRVASTVPAEDRMTLSQSPDDGVWASGNNAPAPRRLSKLGRR